jgi:hypothetical protein
MKIRTKKDTEQFLKGYKEYFILRKKDDFAYFPISFRGYFGNYAMIYHYDNTGEWEAAFDTEKIISKDIKEIEKFVWDKRDEINYTLSKSSNCTCPVCNESRWYAVGPSYRGNLKRALCSSCLNAFDLEEEVKDSYYSLPSM